jgi:hypothetical protein
MQNNPARYGFPTVFGTSLVGGFPQDGFLASRSNSSCSPGNTYARDGLNKEYEDIF